MPYMDKPTHNPDTGQWCNHKRNPDGSRGEQVGCSDTQEEAEKALIALHMHTQEALPTDLRISMGGAVRAVGDGVIEGMLVPFTDATRKDLYGTYWDTTSDLMLQDFPPEQYHVLYHHGLDTTVSVRTVGTVIHAELTDAGLWLKAQLNMRDEYDRMIYELAQSGKLDYSSGALPQGVDVNKETGHVRRWPIIDASLTPTPATPFDRTKIYTLRSYQDALLIPARDGSNHIEHGTEALSNGTNQSRKEDTTMAVQRAMTDIADALKAILAEIMTYVESEGGDQMPTEEAVAVEAALTDELGARMAKLEKEIPTWNEEQFRSWVDEQVGEVLLSAIEKGLAVRASREKNMRAVAKAAFSKVEPQPLPGHKTNGRISGVQDMRYAHMSADDMALGYMLLTSRARSLGMQIRPTDFVSEDYLRQMAHKARSYADSNPCDTNNLLTHQQKVTGNIALRSLVPWRADELDASDIATQGQEWAGEWWSTNLWVKARYPRIYDTLVSKGMFVEDLPQGTDVAHFPTEGADPVAYMAPQANSLDATGRPEVTVNINPFVTGVVNCTPAEIKVASGVTVILGEDSVIRIASQVNTMLSEKALETRDQLMLNGDTETAANTNINIIDGTPGVGLQTPYYLAANGFRKLPLVTLTTRSRDAANACTLADFRKTFMLIPGELRTNKTRLAFIIDPDTEAAALAIPEIATADVRPVYATVENGEVRGVYGVDVLNSGSLPSANTAGKVNSVSPTTNNVRGTILLLYAPYWGFAYKRQVTTEVVHDGYSSTDVYILSMRLGIVARGTNAAALSYNVAHS